MQLVQLFIGEEMEIELSTNSIFIRLPLVGQVFKMKGDRAVWDSWKGVKEAEKR